MSFQEAISIPILFELTQCDITLEPGYSDTEYFHNKIAEWFPSESASLRRQRISDGSQTKEYNSIRQGIRELAKWEPVPIDWERRKNLAINRHGLACLQKLIVNRCDEKSSPERQSVAKISLDEFSRFVRKNRDRLRPKLISYVRAKHKLR